MRAATRTRPMAQAWDHRHGPCQLASCLGHYSAPRRIPKGRSAGQGSPPAWGLSVAYWPSLVVAGAPPGGCASRPRGAGAPRSASRPAMSWMSMRRKASGSSGRAGDDRVPATVPVADGWRGDVLLPLDLPQPARWVEYSMISFVAPSSRWVRTTSVMSARNRSPCGPAGSGPAATARPADVRVAWPRPLVTLNRIVRGAVQGEPRISAQVGPLARPGHRPEPQLTVGELRLDPADAR